MFVRCSRILMLAIVIQSLAIGCSNSSIVVPKTVPVRGSVASNGKPVPGVRVKFHPQFEMGEVEFIPYGETGADGKFQLSTGLSGNGAPQGEYIVTMEMPYIDIDPKDGLEAERDRLRGAYSLPSKSKWNVVLHAGENELPPFELKLP